MPHRRSIIALGKMPTARDTTHKRMVDLTDAGHPLPVNLHGRVIYCIDPVRAVRDEAAGSTGTTTSTRMDMFKEVEWSRQIGGFLAFSPTLPASQFHDALDPKR